MDICLHYKETGNGFPLILLHGNGENGEYFKYQVEYFAKEYRVIAVDTRGHGKSPRGTMPFTIRQFAEDLNVFFEQLHISQAILLGFSDGANIAMTFAMKYPDKVKKLILNGGNLNAKGVKRTVQIPIEIGYWLTKRFAGHSQEAKRHMELLALMVDEPNIDPSELNMLRMPTLVIAGTKDMIMESHTRLIAASIPNAELEIIEGDHFIAQKTPEEFNKAVERFLRQDV